MMVSEKEYKDALQKVIDYAVEKSPSAINTSDIGAKVTLSDFGIEMQGKDKRKKSGIVIAWRQWMHFPNDGTVTVKWDGIAEPQDMHLHQVKILK